MAPAEGHETFAGQAGATRREPLVVRCPCGASHTVEAVRGVDAAADPELARALRDPAPGTRLNEFACPVTGAAFALDLPIVYHDPGGQVFALVLPEGARHRELDERAALWAELASDRRQPPPAYVRAFEVVFGPSGLRAELERAAEQRIAAERRDRSARELDRCRDALAEREAELLRREAALADRAAALDRRSEESGRTGDARREDTRREPRPTAGRSRTIHSEQHAVASGVIGDPADEPPPHLRSERSLIAQLGDVSRRVSAAVELGNRGHASALEPVFEAIASMTRTEASAALASVVGFGAAATPFLVRGLRSRRAYVRQGCALALAVVGGDQAVEALGDQLVDEPTEIWREIARALGELGGSAIAPLAARARRAAEDRRERVAWALAHIAVGDRKRVEALAQGRDPIAAGAARHALELTRLAASDRAEVRGPDQSREVTVNRAFSRRFFEAMNAPAGELLAAASSPAYVLDEADLLEPDHDEADDAPAEPLDEADLLPGA